MKTLIFNKLILTAFFLLIFVTCSKLSQTNLQSAPEIPSDPVPADGAELGSLDIELSWTCSDLDGDPLTYDIYLDTLTTPAIYDSLIDTTIYTAARLYYNITYYWQVVAKDSSDRETEGPVWSFVIGDDETVPTVTLTAPNGGELWYVDDEHDITWEAADDDSIASYKLEYTADEGTTWVDIQDWTDGNPQTFAWTIPATPSTRHKVRVSCQDFGGNIVVDYSDTLFTAWPDGGMIAFVSDREGTYNIFSMFADGSNQRNISNNSTGIDFSPTWSPDCSKIAFYSNRDGNSEIYVMNSDGNNQVNISNNAAEDAWPGWSPNGDKIAFSTTRTGNYEVYIMDIDGSNQFNLTNNAASDSYCSWSPDALGIAFHSDRGSNYDIYIMDNTGGSQTRLTTHAQIDAYPAWSPNGLLIAFSSYRDANWEIYLMNVDGSNQHNISINASTDNFVRWSPDGTRLVFMSDRTGDYDIYVMDTDGTNLQNLTNSPSSYDGYPSWSPID